MLIPALTNSTKGSTSVQLDNSNKYITVSYDLQCPLGPLEADSELPLLLFIHPFTCSGDFWQPNLKDDAISKKFWTVTVDVIGHGGSSSFLESWTMWDVARSITQIISQLANPALPKKVVIVGLSQGGFIGLRAAHLDHKEGHDRIAGLVVIGSSADKEDADFYKQNYELANSIAEKAKSNPFGAISQLAQTMANDQLGILDGVAEGKDWVPFVRDIIEQSLSRACSKKEFYQTQVANQQTLDNIKTNLDSDHVAKQILINFDALLKRDSLIELLSKSSTDKIGINAPVHIIHGDKERAYPIERKHHENMEKALKQGGQEVTLSIIRGLPHFGSVTHAHEIDQHIVRFVEMLNKN